MANFFLVCGISGGGKTFLSKKIVEKNAGLKMFDVDEYYKFINGDECIRENKFDVWMTMFKDIHCAELRGENVLLTTNSLTRGQRRQFVEWFPSFDHHMLWVTAPKDKCIIGNMSRRRHLPEEILLEDWERMEFPNASEDGWVSIAQVTNLWDYENYIIFNLKGDITKILKL